MVPPNLKDVVMPFCCGNCNEYKWCAINQEYRCRKYSYCVEYEQICDFHETIVYGN